MSGSRDIISAEYRELFEKNYRLQQKWSAVVRKVNRTSLLLQIFYCIYSCFECKIKQLLVSAYA